MLWELSLDSSNWITAMPYALCTGRIYSDTCMDLCQGKVQNWATFRSQMQISSYEPTWLMSGLGHECFPTDTEDIALLYVLTVAKFELSLFSHKYKTLHSVGSNLELLTDPLSLSFLGM